MSDGTTVEPAHAVCTHHEVIAIGLIEVRKGQVELTRGQQATMVVLGRIEEKLANGSRDIARAEKERAVIVADFGPRITTLELLAARALGYAAGVSACVSVLILTVYWLVSTLGSRT